MHRLRSLPLPFPLGSHSGSHYFFVQGTFFYNQSDSARTPLMRAAESKSVEALETLLSLRADPNVRGIVCLVQNPHVNVGRIMYSSSQLSFSFSESKRQTLDTHTYTRIGSLCTALTRVLVFCCPCIPLSSVSTSRSVCPSAQELARHAFSACRRGREPALRARAAGGARRWKRHASGMCCMMKSVAWKATLFLTKLFHSLLSRVSLL